MTLLEVLGTILGLRIENRVGWADLTIAGNGMIAVTSGLI